MFALYLSAQRNYIVACQSEVSNDPLPLQPGYLDHRNTLVIDLWEGIEGEKIGKMSWFDMWY